MPTTKKTPASKAAPQTEASTTLTVREQASAELAAEQSWSVFKGKVIAAACRLYQEGHLHNAADVSELLNPLQNELREAISITTGIAGGDIREKLINLILDKRSVSEASMILQQVTGVSISPEQAKNLILSRPENFTAWHTDSLKDRYYPLVFLHQNYVDIIDDEAGNDHAAKSQFCHMYTAFGITEDGMRELISFYFDNVSIRRSYCGLLEQLCDRELPAPLLVTGNYEGNNFTQKQLALFYPQSYFIPNQQDTSSKVNEDIPTYFGRRAEYRNIIKGIYKSVSLDEFNNVFAPILKEENWASVHSLGWLNKTLRNVFPPEVAKALVSTSPALRKLMFEKPPFGKEVEQIEPILMQSGVYDVTQLSILMHQYYEQVLRKEWQRTVSSWSRLKGDLQAFAQAMQ